MIFVDRRVGSRELEPAISTLGVPTRVRELKFGDFAFMTRAGLPGDRPGFIGIERKRIRDMVSSIQTGRYSGYQLPGMLEMYDLSYLIVEGGYRRNQETACLELPSGDGRWTSRVWKSQYFDYRALDAFLNTIRLKTPVRVIKTFSASQTAMEVYLLWHWHNSKRWSLHKGHEAFRQTPDSSPGHLPPSQFRAVVKELPHIGMERSKQVEQVFDKSLRKAFNATPAQWQLVEGINKARAEEIVEFIRTGKEGRK